MTKSSIGTRNRSIERGIEILRAFRPGVDLLGNSELSERTGLSPATVSRLTQTLVRCSMLEPDRKARAYRLGPLVLCLSHAMRGSSPILKIASPLMKSLGERLSINVGLAVPDRDEMIYIESFRYNNKRALRTVVSGQRIPIELTSLGRAYLSTLSPLDRDKLFSFIKSKRNKFSRALEKDINRSIQCVNKDGYCTVSWQPEVIAISTPILIQDCRTYILNVSTTSNRSMNDVSVQLSSHLLDLKKSIIREFSDTERV